MLLLANMITQWYLRRLAACFASITIAVGVVGFFI